MALKSYDEMRKIDVKPYCEKRDGLDYLNWAMCIDLLHKNGAKKAYWEPIENEKTGNSLRMSDVAFVDKNGVQNRCWVVGNGRTWDTLTETEAAHMLKALKDRYGDD